MTLALSKATVRLLVFAAGLVVAAAAYSAVTPSPAAGQACINDGVTDWCGAEWGCIEDPDGLGGHCETVLAMMIAAGTLDENLNVISTRAGGWGCVEREPMYRRWPDHCDFVIDEMIALGNISEHPWKGTTTTTTAPPTTTTELGPTTTRSTPSTTGTASRTTRATRPPTTAGTVPPPSAPADRCWGWECSTADTSVGPTLPGPDRWGLANCWGWECSVKTEFRVGDGSNELYPYLLAEELRLSPDQRFMYKDVAIWDHVPAGSWVHDHGRVYRNGRYIGHILTKAPPLPPIRPATPPERCDEADMVVVDASRMVGTTVTTTGTTAPPQGPTTTAGGPTVCLGDFPTGDVLLILVGFIPYVGEVTDGVICVVEFTDAAMALDTVDEDLEAVDALVNCGGFLIPIVGSKVFDSTSEAFKAARRAERGIPSNAAADSWLRGLPPKLEAEDLGGGWFQTMAGLKYGPTDPGSPHRANHAMKHAVDDPNRPGRHGHGVFYGDPLEVADDAYRLSLLEPDTVRFVGSQSDTTGSKVWDGDTQLGRSDVLVVDVGETVGWIGGSQGREWGNPDVDLVGIFFEPGTTEVLTTFPVSPSLLKELETGRKVPEWPG